MLGLKIANSLKLSTRILNMAQKLVALVNFANQQDPTMHLQLSSLGTESVTPFVNGLRQDMQQVHLNSKKYQTMLRFLV